MHLPQLDLDGHGLSRERVLAVVDAAKEGGFAAVSANDHVVFGRPWVDGLTLLSLVASRTRGMDLMTSVALPTLRGPLPVACAVSAIDAMSDGRVVLGVAPGSSRADYEALDVPFEQRGARLEEAAAALRALLKGEPAPQPPRWYPVPSTWTPPPSDRARGVEVWIGSWGSASGLGRAARLGDGWLASAYNGDPERFAQALRVLGPSRAPAGAASQVFPNALVTMWTWVTDRSSETEQKLSDVARLVGRDPQTLAGKLCIGSAQRCAELLSRYAEAGCQQVQFWPLGDERRQIELIAGQVLPRVTGA